MSNERYTRCSCRAGAHCRGWFRFSFGRLKEEAVRLQLQVEHVAQIDGIDTSRVPGTTDMQHTRQAVGQLFLWISEEGLSGRWDRDRGIQSDYVSRHHPLL